MVRATTLRLAAFACICSLQWTYAHADPKPVDVPAGDLAAALESLAQQAGIELVFSQDQVKGLRTQGFKGVLPPKEIAAKLIEGTPLKLSLDPSGAMLIAAPAANGASSPAPSAPPRSSAPAAQEPPTAAQGAGEQLQEVIVTGSLVGAQANPSSAVSVLNAQEIMKSAPVSAADVLKSVPGVFVNSALGEIRNIIYSRGVSANSSDAASGYYYVSLQEDGLPVTNVTFNNYGPDYFYRTDLTLARVEALRGGTATVTGPNAPGGIFNYISRTGQSAPEFQVSTRFGLENDGENLYRRADFYAGDEIGSSSLYYSVGAFYRKSEGARDSSYPANRGGQLKANLLWDYGAGTLLLYGKYLDDRNSWSEFLPARNFSDPTVVAELGNSASLRPPSSPHAIVDTTGNADTWDGSNLDHNRAINVGLKFDHDINETWSVSNNLKYVDNRADWNTGALLFPVPITDSFLSTQLNATRNGVYTYSDRATGQVLATVNNVNGVRTVTQNNLPNASVLANGIVPQVAFNTQPTTVEWMDQFHVIKSFDKMSFKLGAFFASSNVYLRGGGGGIGVAPLVNLPQLMDITFTPAGSTTVQQLTDPTGFAGIGQRFGGATTDATQKQLSVFFGHDWELTPQFAVDWGLRYEDLKVDGFNRQVVQNPRANDVTFGGIDGNPHTLYDNFQASLGAPISYERSLNFLSYTGSARYRLDNEDTVYVRYSQGEKAPDITFYAGFTTAAQAALLPAVSQKVQQLELGYRLAREAYRLTLSPFYSKLSRVGGAQLFNNPDGSSYTTDPLYSTTETLGVEIEGDVNFARIFNVRTALTFQRPESKDFAIWIANGLGPADDTISAVPDGDADNNPKVMANTTLQVSPTDRFAGFLTWKYMGSRAANRYDTFQLPAFSQFDLGASFDALRNVTVSLNVNNVFNSEGVMSWAPSGGLLASLDRQAFTPQQLAANPNQLFNVLTVQPRAYFISASARF